jgi:hypothetical protein
VRVEAGHQLAGGRVDGDQVGPVDGGRAVADGGEAAADVDGVAELGDGAHLPP